MNGKSTAFLTAVGRLCTHIVMYRVARKM